MRVSLKGLAKLSLALLIPVSVMFSSCSEDEIGPNFMPPKDQIKTPPRKE